jgi:Tfp pilus assembly protein PilN
MQEINLLQNKVKDRTLSFERSNRLTVGIFVMLIIVELVAVAFLFAVIHAKKSSLADLQDQNAKIQADLNSNQKDVPAAKSLQAQLQNVQSLLNNHIYWSPFFTLLAQETPKKIQITTIDGASSDGKIHLEGAANTYTDIGSLILSLATSANYKDVKLLAITTAKEHNTGYSFSLSFQALPKTFTKN